MTDQQDKNKKKDNDLIILQYTRKQALEIGQQVKLDGELATIARDAGFIWPVYITSGVKGLIEKAIAGGSYDFKGVLWDVLCLAARTGQKLSESTKKFKVKISGLNYELYAQVGATDIDDAAPCITIMMERDL
jgi:hypothetical protein